LSFLFRYILSTSDGFEVVLIDYGATIQSIRQPNQHNQIDEITLGYDTLEGRSISNQIIVLYPLVRICE
jgi:aldose 1-epimerase